jgi:hypothetical protein
LTVSSPSASRLAAGDGLSSTKDCWRSITYKATATAATPTPPKNSGIRNSEGIRDRSGGTCKATDVSAMAGGGVCADGATASEVMDAEGGTLGFANSRSP